MEKSFKTSGTARKKGKINDLIIHIDGKCNFFVVIVFEVRSSVCGTSLWYYIAIVITLTNYLACISNDLASACLYLSALKYIVAR